MDRRHVKAPPLSNRPPEIMKQQSAEIPAATKYRLALRQAVVPDSSGEHADRQGLGREHYLQLTSVAGISTLQSPPRHQVTRSKRVLTHAS